MVAPSSNLHNTPTSSDSELEGQPFGQKEPLTRRLNGLIRNYPKGVGILQEFIQNADDAGASEVKILMDWRTHPSTQLPGVSMKSLMGPALLIYNDQVFSDSDLVGIQEIGRGDKFQATSKTGRFGLGFNACYNVTDCPCFLTRDHLHFFDPHHHYIPGADEENPGRSWKLSEKVWHSFSHMLSPFYAMGLGQRQANFQGTIFRLPLRTEEQASKSEISTEPFSKYDFKRLISQLVDIGPELLLFLKHVTEITVEEVSDDEQNQKSLLVLKTVNRAEVKEKRDAINQVVVDDARAMISRLKQSPTSAPRISYLHQIHIISQDVDIVRVWRVVNGIYLDPGNEVLQVAEKMIAQGEKSISWAGAAAEIPSGPELAERKSKHKVGRLYCFLPLPVPGECPVHLNGFFDVDSSRSQATTNNQTLIGKDEVRSRWNEYLVKHCVAKAYADLIEALVLDIGQNDPMAFYELWPDPIDTGLLAGLPTMVYKYLQSKHVIRSARDKSWVSPKNISIAPSNHENIHPAFVEAGMSIPDPKLSSVLVSGFAKTGYPLKNLRPRDVRDHFRITRDINTPLTEFNYQSLCDPQRLAEILAYSMSDGVSDQWYRGLPFMLLCDGNVHTIGYFPATNAYLADAKAHKIFSHFPTWFVDPVFANNSQLVAHPGVNIIGMELEDVIEKLKEVVFLDDSKKWAEWIPDNSIPPNLDWLILVYEYLAANNHKIKDLRNRLDGIPIIPDQFNRLWEAGSFSTPLLPQENQDSKLLRSLDELSIPIISGTQSFLSSARDLIKKTEGLIWWLTPIDLIDLLDAQISDRENGKPYPYNPFIMDPILDFLSTPQALSEIQNNKNSLSKLKGLSIFPANDNILTSLSSPNVYLAGNYDPPSVAGKVRLYNAGPNGQWRSLYKLLGVQDLDEATLTLEVLLPSFSELSVKNQYKAIEWIRDNRSKAEAEYNKKPKYPAKSFRECLGCAAIIRCEDGESRPCIDVYDPRCKEEILAILGEHTCFPNMHYYEKDEELWLEFFAELSIAATPQAKDILGTLHRLASMPELTSEGVKNIDLILQHLAKHWSNLKDVIVIDPVTNNGATLVEILKEKNWLPARQRVDSKRFVGFQKPEARLFKPTELYLAQHGELVCSQKPIAESYDLNAGIRNDLGFAEPILDIVMAHFDYLLVLWEKPGHSEIEISALETTVSEIYNYFGRIFEKEEANNIAPSSPMSQVRKIQAHYLDKACVWSFFESNEQNKKFWAPKHVFKETVTYFTPLRTKIQHTKNLVIDHAYDSLGRKERPQVIDFVGYLEEINERNDGKVTGELLGQVLYVLQKLTDLVRDETAKIDSIFLPTQEGTLVRSDEIFVSDAPWYEGRISNVHLLHDRVSTALIEALDVKRLSKHIVEELLNSPVNCEINSEEQDLCRSWQTTVQSMQFQHGLNRLIHNEDGVIRNGVLTWLSSVQIVAVEPIHTNLYLQTGWIRKLVGQGQTEFHYDEDQNIIYVTSSSQRLMETYVAQAINQQLEPPLIDLSNLITIVALEASEIEKTLNRLRIPSWNDALPIQEFILSQDVLDEAFDVEMSDSEIIEETVDKVADNEDGGLEESFGNMPSQFSSPIVATSIVEGIIPGEGSEIQPPIIAGDGTSNLISSPLKSWPDAKPLYFSGLSSIGSRSARDGIFISRVFHERHKEDQGEGGLSENQQMEIGKKAVERVLKFETRHNRIPKSMPHNHPGYDIESFAKDEITLLRYIEVKGLAGEWGANGVSISPTQLDFAREHSDTYWLYVVEQVFDDSLCRVYPIHDIATKINEFRFDHGWKALKEAISDEDKATSTPRVGGQILLNNGTIAEIIEIEALPGSISVIRLFIEFDDKSTKWVLFRPTQMRLLA